MSEQGRLPELEELYAKADQLAGRRVAVDRLLNGQYIVLWMRFEHSPPAAAHSEAEALEKFIEMMGNVKSDVGPELTDTEVESFKSELMGT